MWRTRLPLGLLFAVASCQPTGGGSETDPLGELPPISDFPRSGEGITVSPVTTGNGPVPAPATGAGGAGTADPRVPVVGGTGGAGAPSAMTPVPPTSPTSGGGAGGTAGSMDAGAAMPSGDAGLSRPAAGATDAGPMPDAGDASCPRLLAPDSGVCASYGCRLSLDQLRASASMTGACTSPAALAAACDGSASSAALRCTEASVFTADLRQAASACVKREPQLNPLGATCLDCFVDEALCTLSRCFALCALASENDDCRACRHKECGDTLSQCTGFPAP